MEDIISKNDFYEWAYSDLLVNNQRGHLAEYIVAKALNLTSQKRLEWDPYDLKYGNIKIEVKSCAYIQSWEQKKYSCISFSIAPSRLYNYEQNQYEEVIKRQADIYVFCLLKHMDKTTINPLSPEQWDFYIVPTKILNEKCPKQKSITLPKLTKLGINSIQFKDIKNYIDHLELL